jgi:hypothetical protein
MDRTHPVSKYRLSGVSACARAPDGQRTAALAHRLVSLVAHFAAIAIAATATPNATHHQFTALPLQRSCAPAIRGGPAVHSTAMKVCVKLVKSRAQPVKLQNALTNQLREVGVSLASNL